MKDPTGYRIEQFNAKFENKNLKMRHGGKEVYFKFAVFRGEERVTPWGSFKAAEKRVSDGNFHHIYK